MFVAAYPHQIFCGRTMMAAQDEHPLHILAAHDMSTVPRALAIITKTQGGGVRSPGALMSIGADGTCRGYLSGGCIDADVAAQAQDCLKSGQSVSLQYGAGSQARDLVLPCGGAIHVTILPKIDAAICERARQALQARTPLTVAFPGLPRFTYSPPLRLRLAGRGADLLAMARLAEACGYGASLWSPDPAIELGRDGQILRTPGTLPSAKDDPWTAFLLLFHDREWETALLSQALAGPAFYIGAVGSQAAQARLRDGLRALGHGPDDLERLRGPVGLIPSMRDASALAVSAMAEILRDYHAQNRAMAVAA